MLRYPPAWPYIADRCWYPLCDMGDMPIVRGRSELVCQYPMDQFPTEIVPVGRPECQYAVSCIFFCIGTFTPLLMLRNITI